MQIELVTTPYSEMASNILLVGLWEGEAELPSDIAELNEKLNNAIKCFVIEKEKFNGAYGKFYKIPTYGTLPSDKIIFFGLGKKSELTLNKLRVLASKIVKKCATVKNNKNISFSMLNLQDTPFGICDAVKVLTEGLMIGEYSFDKYKNLDKTSTEDEEKIENIALTDLSESNINDAISGFANGLIVSESVNFARDLINDQPQVVTPDKIAQTALSLSEVEVKIYEKDQIEEMGMGAFLGVAQGGGYAPKFIHIKYACENPKKKIAIIGKSITFDSGGLDLKPPASMLNMKDDMSGSAAVLGVMLALPKLNPNVEVHGIIASTENMISEKAFKPGDILTAKNKKTIEIDNTDAEGRLTLADALCYAEELEVDEIIDIATLTGACLVALGSAASGIMGSNDELIKKLIKEADSEGENLWELPMYDDYKEALKSDIADMKNTGSRNGGASIAGVFLKNFVKDTPWAHIDIAGTAFLEKAQGEYGKGATGVGVRTLIKHILSV